MNSKPKKRRVTVLLEEQTYLMFCSKFGPYKWKALNAILSMLENVEIDVSRLFTLSNAEIETELAGRIQEHLCGSKIARDNKASSYSTQSHNSSSTSEMNHHMVDSATHNQSIATQPHIDIESWW